MAAAIRFRQTPLRNAALLPAVAWVALVASLALDPAARARDEAVVTAPIAERFVQQPKRCLRTGVCPRCAHVR